MSWRWFLTRLTGLSADSRWVAALRSDHSGARELTDAQAEAHFAAIGA